MDAQLIIAISLVILLVMAGIFGFYLLRKIFFHLKWKNANDKLKVVKKTAEAIKSGDMIDSKAFDKVASKKDSFIDTNTLQREKDVNYAYQNINYRNELIKDIYAGYKALDKYAGQKTISALKSKKTSELYPSKPENDIDKSKIKKKDAKLYMQERNISYSYTKPMSIIERFLWIITAVFAFASLVLSGGEGNLPTILVSVAMVVFLISLVMWGLRFIGFKLQLSDKNIKDLNKKIFEDVKTIQWLDDILTGFLDRNPHCLPILQAEFASE